MGFLHYALSKRIFSEFYWETGDGKIYSQFYRFMKALYSPNIFTICTLGEKSLNSQWLVFTKHWAASSLMGSSLRNALSSSALTFAGRVAPREALVGSWAQRHRIILGWSSTGLSDTVVFVLHSTPWSGHKRTWLIDSSKYYTGSYVSLKLLAKTSDSEWISGRLDWLI